jgi:hypothetical protein
MAAERDTFQTRTRIKLQWKKAREVVGEGGLTYQEAKNDRRFPGELFCVPPRITKEKLQQA